MKGASASAGRADRVVTVTCVQAPGPKPLKARSRKVYPVLGCRFRTQIWY
jgi:hypothetical protein